MLDFTEDSVLNAQTVQQLNTEFRGPSVVLTDEYRYRILKLLEADPELSQRQLARELGVSLGRANFCLQALVERGLLKVGNFRNSRNKRAYLYLLTPKGVEEKSKSTYRFLKRKMAEYEDLKRELGELRREVAALRRPGNGGHAD
jgi:EPS-associated MarR family transcriptional regulator